jgi:hypothetical protein
MVPYPQKNAALVSGAWSMDKDTPQGSPKATFLCFFGLKIASGNGFLSDPKSKTAVFTLGL